MKKKEMSSGRAKKHIVTVIDVSKNVTGVTTVSQMMMMMIMMMLMTPAGLVVRGPSDECGRERHGSGGSSTHCGVGDLGPEED